MKSVWNFISASMGICISLISCGWLVRGCDSCYFFGLLGLIFGAMIFVFSWEGSEIPKINWRQARRNLSMPTKLWSDKRWVIGYWLQFFFMESYGIIGALLCVWGMMVITYGFPLKGLVIGVVGTGFIYLALVGYQNLCKYVEEEQPKFKRRR